MVFGFTWISIKLSVLSSLDMASESMAMQERVIDAIKSEKNEELRLIYSQLEEENTFLEDIDVNKLVQKNFFKKCSSSQLLLLLILYLKLT